MTPAASDPAATIALEAAATALLHEVAAGAKRAGVFASVRISPNRVECEARDSAAPACYRFERLGPDFWVSLVMKDRWQSQSIEADLVHTGDKLEDLIAEEVGEAGYEGEARTPCEHFRSEEKEFTFRSKVPINLSTPVAESAKAALPWLLGYEACFRRLGDMEGGDED